jgi:hypothetical protein
MSLLRSVGFNVTASIVGIFGKDRPCYLSPSYPMKDVANVMVLRYNPIGAFSDFIAAPDRHSIANQILGESEKCLPRSLIDHLMSPYFKRLQLHYLREG